MHRSLTVPHASDFHTVYPVNTVHRIYPAQISTASRISWVVDSPATDLLLDSEAYIIYTVTYRPDVDELSGNPDNFEGVARAILTEGDAFPAPSAAVERSRIALRQGFCVMNAIEKCSLRLNQSKDEVRPVEWNGEFTRFYALPEEIDSICSMSGGALDSGNFSNRVVDDFEFETSPFDVNLIGVGDQLLMRVAPGYERAVVPLEPDVSANCRASTPRLKRFYNPGLTDRWHKSAEVSRLGAQEADTEPEEDGSNPRYAESPTVQVCERVPIEPFLLWQRKSPQKRIPGVRRLELDLEFGPQAAQLILQGRSDRTTGEEFDEEAFVPFVDYFSVTPTLHLKWITPPASMPSPLPMVLPYQRMYTRVLPGVAVSILSTQFFSDLLTVTAHNIRFPAVPKQLMLYLKPRLSDADIVSPTERHLEIVSLKLGYTTAKGSFFSAASQQLFAMYVKNSPVSTWRAFDYDQWRRRFCTVVLRPEDHGIRMVDPGGVILDLDLEVRSHWNFPSIGSDVQYNFESQQPDPEQALFEQLVEYQLFVVALWDWGMHISETDTDIRALA